MDIPKSEYRADCPECKTDCYTGIISAKESRRRYYCSNCACEFEISKTKTTVYRMSANGHLYKIRVIEDAKSFKK